MVTLALFPIFAVVFPFTLDSTISDPKLLFITSKQCGVAFVALDIVIGTVMLTTVPSRIPPPMVTMFDIPRRISESRAAQNNE
jgi:hypothetical protein